MINKTLFIYKGDTGIGNLHTIIEYLDNRACTCQKEILMNNEMINRLYRTFFRGSVRKLHTFEFEVDDNIFIGVYFNSIDHSISDVLCQLMGGSIIDKSLAAELHGIVVLFCFFTFGNDLIQPFLCIIPFFFDNCVLLFEC